MPKFLVPVRPRGVVLSGQGVLIDCGRIEALGPREELLARYPDADRVELQTHALLPGLINMHTHSAMALLRGFADDLELSTWLREHIWPAEQRWMSEAFVRDGTRLAIAEMLQCGTTCFNDMYFFPEVTSEAAAQAGIRACVGAPIMEFETAWANGFEDYLAKAESFAASCAGDGLVWPSLAPHAAYTVNDEMLERISGIAADQDIGVHMHVLEVAWEIQHSLQEYDERPLARLDRHGLLNPRFMAVHMAHLLEADIRLLAERGVSVVHCPESNLKLASGFCPVSQLTEGGVNVCIGTDGAASNNNLDLLGEMRTASLLAKGVSGDPCAVDASSALEMVTINAAQALGRSADIGSIEAGKRADLCAIDLDHPATQPLHQVLSQIVYAASSRQVSDVWVDGRRLLRQGELTTLDLESVLERARHWNRQMEGQ